jgi:hypothetical protein
VASRNHTTHQHVLVVGDGEGSPSVKGIEERINVRDVPIRRTPKTSWPTATTSFPTMSWG